MVGPDLYATCDPETDDAVALEAAYRTARILALLTRRDARVQSTPRQSPAPWRT